VISTSWRFKSKEASGYYYVQRNSDQIGGLFGSMQSENFHSASAMNAMEGCTFDTHKREHLQSCV
jgi:hypothetical protein